MATNTLLHSFEIHDPLEMQSSGAIEVTLTLINGERRWCYFMTPRALEQCGYWIDGTQVRFHSGAAHMIVVAASLDHAIIEAALRTIDREGRLEECTLPFD